MTTTKVANHYGDDPHSTNIFLVLGKYVERQDENLLTQALVLLFNRVVPFREAFCKLLFDRSSIAEIDTNILVAHSQVGRRVYGGRVLVDMEIRLKGSSAPLFLIESKLDSGLGAGQLRNYRSALKRLPKSTRLVVLTRHGIDVGLWKYTPRKTIWLSWPIVAEIADLTARRASRLDQFLLRDFLYMTRLKGIPTVPRMTTDGYRRLSKFSSFAMSIKSTRLNRKTIAAIDLALQRLEEHRDSVWESLFSNGRDWRTYQNIYKWDDKCTVLQAGFWRPRPCRNVSESYLGLELACGAKPRLCIAKGWRFSPSHPRYTRENSGEHWEYEYSVPDTRRMFKKPMPQATKDIEKNMRRIGAAFLRSRFAGS